MKRRGVAAFLAILLALSLILSACGGSSPSTEDKPADQAGGSEPAAAQPVTLKFAHAGSETHQYHIAATKFKELVEQKTEGSVKIEIYPNAQLGSEREEAEGVRIGTIDLATVSADGMMANWVPELSVFAVPFLFRDRDHVYSVLYGEIGKNFDKKMEEQGFKNLAYWEIGFRNLTNNVRAVNRPEDVEGLKIRVQEAKVWIEFMKSLGAIPSPIPFGELYTALQQKVVDGQENPIATIQSMKFYEVQKYLALTEHTYSPSVVVINPDTWAKLSPEQQQAVQEAAREAGEYQVNLLAERESDGIDDLKSKGMVVTEPDREAFAEVTKDVADAISDKVPAQLVEDIRNTK